MTITSNIHCNLAAWQASHAYSVLGARVSNAGNAYQVITTGTSAGSGGPTTTGSNITDGTVHWKWLSTTDFVSTGSAALQAWADALSNPLTDNVVGSVWNNGTITATLNAVLLYIAARTPSAFTITLRPAPGEGIFDSGSAVLLFDATRGVSFTQPNADSGVFFYFNMEDNGIIFDGLQFKDPRATGSSSIIGSVGTGNIVRNCIFDGFGRASNKMVELVGASVIENCLLLDGNTSASLNLLGVSTGPTRIVNNLFVSKNNVGTSQAVFCEGAGSANDGHIIRNCGIFGWSASEPIWSDHTGQITADHCITDSASILDRALDGGGNLVSKTLANQVRSTTTDYRLKAGADCLRAGVVTTDSLYSIFGLERGPLVDIGPDQATVARDFGAVRPWTIDFTDDFGPAGDNNLVFSRTVMRDFGSVYDRPFTIDFDQNFGPGSFGDQNIVFNATIARDYASPIEPRLSAIRDIVVPIGSDSATVIVSSGPVVPIEWARVISSAAGSVAPAEWRSTFSRDTAVPDDTTTLFTFSQVGPVEWGLSVLRSTVISNDFNMTRQTLPSMFAEWRATFLRDDTTAIEPDATAAFGMPVPAEWMSSAVLTTATMPVEMGATWLRDHVTPAEFAGSPLGAAIVPVDWGQPAQMSTSFVVPMEFVSRIFQVHPEPLELSTARSRDVTVPTEWTGSTATTLDANAPAEWRGPTVVDVDTSIEWRTAFVVDAMAPSAWVSTIFTDPETAPEMTLSVVSTAFIFPDADAGVRTEDLVSTAEWSSTAQRDVVAPLATAGSATGAMGDADAPMSFGGGLASTPWDVLLEMGAGHRVDTLLTSTWLSLMLSEPETVAETTLSVVGESFIVPDTSFDIITEDHATPIEWSAIAVTGAATFEVEHLAMTITDTIGMADWFGSTLSADVVALIEWTQDTGTTTVDVEIPLDFLSLTVMTDVVIPLERQRLRHSIGAQLEPDEWEREHD